MYHDVSALKPGGMDTEEEAIRFDMNELYKWLERPLSEEEDDNPG